jgi:hypothetical protein
LHTICYEISGLSNITEKDFCDLIQDKTSINLNDDELGNCVQIKNVTLYYPNRGGLSSFECSEFKIRISDSDIKIFEDFIVFPLKDNINLIDITCNSQELDDKAEEFYANRKEEIDQQFLLFVENKNIAEVDVGRSNNLITKI